MIEPYSKHRYQGEGKAIDVSFTRPADTNVYAIGDAVNNSTTAPTILTFPNVVPFKGGQGEILQLTMIDSAAQTLKPDFKLWLFDAAVTMQNDNAAWAISDADMKKYVALFSFEEANFIVAAANGFSPGFGNGFFQCAPASQDLFGVVVANNAYIPISAEEFTFRMLVKTGLFL